MEKEYFDIIEEKNPEGVTFILSGRVNSTSAEELEKKLQKPLQEGQKNIILNMSKVEFLSSIGVRVILRAYQKANDAESKLGIEMPSQTVKNIIGMIGLNEILIK
ncbi:MAG: STAS domain-containing protein [Treponema sp.]|nr:STAS domain-containing protein [Treponema sp.]